MLLDEIHAIHSTVNEIVNKAFYEVFIHDDENWYFLSKVSLDYEMQESEDALTPWVEVSIMYSNKLSGQKMLKTELNLLRSFEFNVGYITNAFLVSSESDDTIGERE